MVKSIYCIKSVVYTAYLRIVHCKVHYYRNIFQNIRIFCYLGPLLTESNVAVI